MEISAEKGERRVKGAIRLDRGSSTPLFIILQPFTGISQWDEYKARQQACPQAPYNLMKKATVNSNI